MGHAPGMMGGSLPEQLHYGHIQSSVIERGGTGHATQHIQLLGIGVPQRSRACRTFALPREACMLPYQAPGAHGQGRPHV